MEDLLSKLTEEQTALEHKLEKLIDFNLSDKVNDVDSVQRDILLIQEKAMNTYNECLKIRIARLQ